MPEETVLWGDESYKVSILTPEEKGKDAYLIYKIRIPMKKLKGVL